MKIYPFILAVLLALPAQATYVRYAATNVWGSADTNYIRVQAIGSPINANGSFVTRGPAFRMIPNASGIADTNLAAGNYVLSNAVLNTNIIFSVPSDSSTNIYLIGDLAISGYNTYNYSPGVRSLTPGGGVGLSATTGNIIITLTNPPSSDLANSTNLPFTGLSSDARSTITNIAGSGGAGISAATATNIVDAKFATVAPLTNNDTRAIAFLEGNLSVGDGTGSNSITGNGDQVFVGSGQTGFVINDLTSTIQVPSGVSLIASGDNTVNGTFTGTFNGTAAGNGAGLTNIVTTGMVARVSGHLAQPFNVTNTILAVISDSHGYYWPELFTNLPAWAGLKAFTNATVGGTVTAVTNASLVASSGTNIFYTRVMPWISNNASTGTTVVLVHGHGTVDAISAINVEYDVQSYLNICSNFYRDVKLRGQTNGWNVVIVRPTMLPVGSTGDTANDDASNNNFWVNNNWLAMAPTNSVDFVVDLTRQFYNNTDTNFWDVDRTHPLKPELRAQEFDLVLRGVRPSRPLPFTAEKFNTQWEWRNATNGALATKLWHSGAFQQLRASPDGQIDASGSWDSYPNVGAVFTGVTGGSKEALALVGRSNQSVAMMSVAPYNGAAAISLWANGNADFSATLRPLNLRIGHTGVLEFTNNTDRVFDFTLDSSGRLMYQDVRNQSLLGSYAELFSINPAWNTARPRINTLGSMNAQMGYYRSNMFSAVGSVAMTDNGYDVVITRTATTATLPTAVGFKGKPFTIANLDLSGTSIVARTSSQTIQGLNSNFNLGPGEVINLLSDDTNWIVTGWYSPYAKTNAGGSGGSATNAIALLNGFGTNTTLRGDAVIEAAAWSVAGDGSANFNLLAATTLTGDGLAVTNVPAGSLSTNALTGTGAFLAVSNNVVVLTNAPAGSGSGLSNVTETASLVTVATNLTVAGKLAVNTGGTLAAPGLTLGGDTGSGWYRGYANQWTWVAGSNPNVSIYAGFMRLQASEEIGWGSTTSESTADVGISRNAAGVLEVNAGSVGALNATLKTGTGIFTNTVTSTNGFAIAGNSINSWDDVTNYFALGGGSQTPWLSTINGGGYYLTNVGWVSAATATITTANIETNNTTDMTVTNFVVLNPWDAANATNLTYNLRTNAINTGIIPVGKTTFTNITGAITIAGLSGVDLNFNQWAKLWVTNSTATDYAVTLAAPFCTATNAFVVAQAIWVTNKSAVTINIDVSAWGTNAAAVRFQR